MKSVRSLAWVCALALGLSGCGREESHSHDANVKAPEDYAGAVAKCEEISIRIGSLIDSRKLSEVHEAAEPGMQLAERLPELAQKKGASGDMLKEINLKSKELAGAFDEIHDAADAGKADDTRKLYEKIKGLVENLKRHAEHLGQR